MSFYLRLITSKMHNGKTATAEFELRMSTKNPKHLRYSPVSTWRAPKKHSTALYEWQ
jgi:hypothetical protein